jgi:hypothetical protein
MTRVGRLVAGAGLAIAGALLTLYGLFAIVYGGDSGGSGDTYVKVGGREIDADLVGAIALVVGLTLALCGTLLLTRRRG